MNKLLDRVKYNQDIREVVFDGKSDIGEIAKNCNDFFGLIHKGGHADPPLSQK